LHCSLFLRFQQNHFDGPTKIIFWSVKQIFSKILDPSEKSFFPYISLQKMWYTIYPRHFNKISPVFSNDFLESGANRPWLRYFLEIISILSPRLFATLTSFVHSMERNVRRNERLKVQLSIVYTQKNKHNNCLKLLSIKININFAHL